MFEIQMKAKNEKQIRCAIYFKHLDIIEPQAEEAWSALQNSLEDAFFTFEGKH